MNCWPPRAKLKEAGITPFTIGTKFLWTAAGVFDYLNLRTNGYDVHNDSDSRRDQIHRSAKSSTFRQLEEAGRAGYFVDNHATMSWQDALAPFANGEAAMYVMGNFSVDAMQEGGLTEDQIDYFQFPEITPGIDARRRSTGRRILHSGECEEQGRCPQIPRVHRTA